MSVQPTAEPVRSTDGETAAAVRALERYIEEVQERREVVAKGVAVVLGRQPWLLSCRPSGLIATPGEFVNDVATYNYGDEDNITERWVDIAASPADILECLAADRAPGRRSGLDYLGDDRAEVLAAQLVDALEPVLPEGIVALCGHGWFAITIHDLTAVLLPLQEMDLCTPDVTARVVRFALDSVQQAVTRELGAPWPHPGGVAYAVMAGVDEIRAGYGDPHAPALELQPLFSP